MCLLFISREFFYIQMEKYARQALAEGCLHADDLVVSADSELFRHLNLHYNRNNQLEVSVMMPAPYPTPCRYIAE